MALSKNRHCEGKCIFENHRLEVVIELNNNFYLLHRYFFSKSCYISYYFQEEIWECFNVQRSVTVSVYIL